MRREIVVLGFFIIVLILIAGCTSTQNATSTGTKSQSTVSVSPTVEGISWPPTPSPTECNLPFADPIRFQKYLPNVPGYERKYGQNITLHQNYFPNSKKDVQISDIYQAPNFSKPYIISVIFVDRGPCFTESVDAYINRFKFDSNNTKINNFHGYPAIHSISASSTNLKDFYQIFISNRISVFINLEGRPTEEYPLSKLLPEGEAELEKFASAMNLNAIASSV